MTRVARLITLGTLASLVAGCETQYATVKGRVTLDGRPLKGALVGFYPNQGRGSHGETDADGRYELRYTNKKAGVPPGPCVVRITTADANTPERLPARYHEKSELAEEVKPGDNVFDFELKSK
ncbi:MAG: hypothetical protein C0501_11955 [Isosphaera sp.]|nr:hypothetical protein [Isosphaera sp.]